MTKRQLAGLMGASMSLLASSNGMAADVAAEVGGTVAAEPPAAIGWSFTTAAYLWAAGMNGDVGLFGLPAQPVDQSFIDVLPNLDGAFTTVFEARKGPISFGVDLMYLKLGSSVDTPVGILANRVNVDVTSVTATVVGGYALIDNGDMTLDAVAGARVWHSSTDFSFVGGVLGGTSQDDGDTWVDPVVGTKFHVGIGGNFYLSGWALAGGFGVSSDLMWDVMGGVGYAYNDHFSAFAGYRALGVDYAKDGFVYDVTQHGPVLAGVFKF